MAEKETISKLIIEVGGKELQLPSASNLPDGLSTTMRLKDSKNVFIPKWSRPFYNFGPTTE